MNNLPSLAGDQFLKENEQIRLDFSFYGKIMKIEPLPGIGRTNIILDKTLSFKGKIDLVAKT